jgi:hypothetical protein
MNLPIAPRGTMVVRYSKATGSLTAGSKPRKSNAARPKPHGTQNAQANYERYLALASAEARTGNTVAAENYYTGRLAPRGSLAPFRHRKRARFANHQTASTNCLPCLFALPQRLQPHKVGAITRGEQNGQPRPKGTRACAACRTDSLVRLVIPFLSTPLLE